MTRDSPGTGGVLRPWDPRLDHLCSRLSEPTAGWQSALSSIPLLMSFSNDPLLQELRSFHSIVLDGSKITMCLLQYDCRVTRQYLSRQHLQSSCKCSAKSSVVVKKKQKQKIKHLFPILNQKSNDNKTLKNQI